MFGAQPLGHRTNRAQACLEHKPIGAPGTNQIEHRVIYSLDTEENRGFLISSKAQALPALPLQVLESSSRSYQQKQLGHQKTRSLSSLYDRTVVCTICTHIKNNPRTGTKAKFRPFVDALKTTIKGIFKAERLDLGVHPISPNLTISAIFLRVFTGFFLSY